MSSAEERGFSLETPNGAAAAGEPPEDLEGVVSWLLENPQLDGVSAALYENRGSGYDFLHTFDSLEDVSIDAIKQEFGGGRYQVRFRRKGVFIKQPTIRIAGRPRPRGDDEGASSSKESERIDRLERMIEQLAAQKHQPSNDIVALATAMAGVQAQTFAAIAPLLKQDKGSNISELADVLMRAIELGKDGGGGGGYGDILTGLGPRVVSLLEKVTDGGGGLLPEQPLPNGGGEVRAERNPAGAPAAPAGAPGWYTVLQPFLGHLIGLARMYGDVDHWAAQLIERADDSQLEWIEQELGRREDFEQEFYRWVPAAAPHRDWFTRFWDAVTEQVALERGEGGEEKPPEKPLPRKARKK